MSEYKKVTHDIAVIGSGDLKNGSLISLSDTWVIKNKLIKGNYLHISYFAKPSSGTMKPKFRLYFLKDGFINSSLAASKWAKGQLLEAQLISDTTNGETWQFEPILITSDIVAILLESCEPGGQLVVFVERSSGGLL